MKKLIKGILTGLFVTLLTVGVVYACVVKVRTTHSNLDEAISTEWVNMLPATVYSNQIHEVRLRITNTDAVGNGNQNVGVKVTTTNLEKLDIWIQGYDWGYKFDNVIKFTMAKGTTKDIVAKVKIPSSQDSMYDPTVTFEVTRE